MRVDVEVRATPLPLLVLPGKELAGKAEGWKIV